jgi:multidrug efflux pump subunit AcrA (membrane-fusion protein)
MPFVGESSVKASSEREVPQGIEISALQLANAQEKYEALLNESRENTIISPATGIVLKPMASSRSSDAQKSAGRVSVGQKIQYQQVVFSIGDMRGVRVRVTVPENLVNRLKVGQSATLTSGGFPGITLHGHIATVGAEASSSGDDSVPRFPVQVVVPSLGVSLSQASEIRSGMSAQVKIELSRQRHQWVIPLSAVHQNAKGRAEIYWYNPQTKSLESREIQTGQVLLKTVQVLSGLTPQDQFACDSTGA